MVKIDMFLHRVQHMTKEGIPSHSVQAVEIQISILRAYGLLRMSFHPLYHGILFQVV